MTEEYEAAPPWPVADLTDEEREVILTLALEVARIAMRSATVQVIPGPLAAPREHGVYPCPVPCDTCQEIRTWMTREAETVADEGAEA